MLLSLLFGETVNSFRSRRDFKGALPSFKVLFTGTLGDTWGHFGTLGDTWGHLGTLGDTWRHLGTLGNN